MILKVVLVDGNRSTRFYKLPLNSYTSQLDPRWIPTSLTMEASIISKGPLAEARNQTRGLEDSMFLLGHSCWSYLFSKATGRRLNVNLPAYLALLSGILPDFDIYFQPYLVHHTYTHSLIVIIPVVLVLTYFFGRLGFAFSIGILSHLLGDFLVGSIPLLYPLYPNSDVGLNLGIPSLADTILEIGAFTLVLLYAYRNGDYRLVLKPSRDSLLLVIPLFALVTLTLLFAGDRSITLAEFAFSRRALTVITLGHILLSGILVAGVLQGFRWYLALGRAKQMTGSQASSRPTSP